MADPETDNRTAQMFEDDYDPTAPIPLGIKDPAGHDMYRDPVTGQTVHADGSLVDPREWEAPAPEPAPSPRPPVEDKPIEASGDKSEGPSKEFIDKHPELHMQPIITPSPNGQQGAAEIEAYEALAVDDDIVEAEVVTAEEDDDDYDAA